MEFVIQNAMFLKTYFSYVKDNALALQWEHLILPGEYYKLFCLFFFGWIFFYKLIDSLPIRNASTKLTLDTKNRIVSIVHAVIMLVLSIYDYSFNQEEKCGAKNSNFQNKMLLFSCSYFSYDLFACLYLNISDMPMFIHHSLVIVAEYSGIIFDSSANEMIRAMIVAEVSNPAMHIRTIISNYGLKHSKLFLLFEIYYFISYSFARLVFGINVCLFTVFCWENLFLVKFSGFLVWAQSLKYCYNMIGITKKRMKELRERNSKQAPLYWLSFNEKLNELDYINKEKTEKYLP